MKLRSILLAACLFLCSGLGAGQASASGFIQTMQLHEKAMKARKAGDLPAAIEAAEAELDVVIQQMGGTPVHLGRVLPFLGELYLEADRYEEAEGAYARAVSVRIQEVGRTSGDVAGLRSRLGECKLGQGDVGAALTLFEQAIAVFKSKGESHDLARAGSMEHLAKALDLAMRSDEAATQRNGALSIYAKKWGEEDPRTAAARQRLER
jgi:tetratricopeptide (TPR) repeat protein